MKEFLNRNLLGILVLVLATIIYFQRCNNDATGDQKADTVIVKEYVQQPPVYIPQYIPIPTNTQPVTVIPPNYIPSSDYKDLLKQFNDLVNKHLETKTYKDSIELKDTSGVKVGIVNLEDIISENEIKSRKPSYQLKFPHTTTTITLPYTPKNQFYVGGGILGNTSQLVSGAKVGIYLKNRRDQLYGVSAHKEFNNRPLIYSIESYWKIRLGKK